MNTYRVYVLSSAGKIISGEWIEAADDEDAKARAVELCKPGSPKVEIWKGTVRIAEVDCATLVSDR